MKKINKQMFLVHALVKIKNDGFCDESAADLMVELARAQQLAIDSGHLKGEKP